MPEYSELRDQLADWILKNSDNVLRTKNLLSVPKLKIEGLKIILARRGKIIQKYGEISNYHKPNWLNQFVLGVRKKGKVLSLNLNIFLIRAWEWQEFQKQWGRLMVAKTGKTFKLWSIQGTPDLFLLIIYDLSNIEKIKLSNDTKRKVSLISNYTMKIQYDLF